MRETDDSQRKRKTKLHFGDPGFGRDRFGHLERYANADHYYDTYSEEESREFAGVGPKGFRLSEESIKEKASEAMAGDEYLDASEIEVEVESGVLVLRGLVENRWMKWRAEDCILGIYGVEDIRNELKVKRRQIQKAGEGPVRESPTFGEIGLKGTTTTGGFNNSLAVFPEREPGEDSDPRNFPLSG